MFYIMMYGVTRVTFYNCLAIAAELFPSGGGWQLRQEDDKGEVYLPGRRHDMECRDTRRS